MNTPRIDGVPFGQLLAVQTFMKGLCRKKPTIVKPKKYQWDIKALVDDLKSMSPWHTLSLIDKGRKTHALLCLATGWRPSSDFQRTLASVDFEFDNQNLSQ